MKIGILTFHRANNYGAVLQCYALQNILQTLNHDVHVIDYRQPDTEDSYKIICWSRLKQSIRQPLSFLKEIAIHCPYRMLQKIGFNKFRKKYLNCTNAIYSASQIPQDFDCYVIGSDQLWSIQCMGGHFDPVFFGQFPHKEKSRIISYAISGNIPSLLTIGIENVKKYLSAFGCLSVREASIADWIKEEIGCPTRQDVDPTMLFDATKWNEITGKRPQKSKYILMYFLLPEQKKHAKDFARKTGLQLIEVGKVAFSPKKFLAYVKHAECILGGSFHVAVFSILFRKQFYIVKKNNEFDVRSEHLLHSLGLDNLFIDVTELARIDMKKMPPVDFKNVESRLSNLRNDSLNYLKSL